MRLKPTIPTRKLLRHTPQIRASSGSCHHHHRFHRSLSSNSRDSNTNLHTLQVATRRIFISNTIPITTTTTTTTTTIARLFSTTTPTMSDSDYMAFLQRQQQQAEALAATTTTTGDLRKRDIGALGTGEEPHAAILSLLQDNSVQEKFYNSGLDVEEFKDVTLEWGKEEMPSEDEFATLISADHVTKEPFSSWDPRGRYHETEAAIKEASGSNEVLVYRASGEGASFNYFVLAKAVKNSRLVGVRFSAVEDVEDDE